MRRQTFCLEIVSKVCLKRKKRKHFIVAIVKKDNQETNDIEINVGPLFKALVYSIKFILLNGI